MISLAVVTAAFFGFVGWVWLGERVKWKMVEWAEEDAKAREEDELR